MLLLGLVLGHSLALLLGSNLGGSSMHGLDQRRLLLLLFLDTVRFGAPITTRACAYIRVYVCPVAWSKEE